MSAVRNLALEAFVQQIGDAFVFAEVLIQKAASGFELRHVRDAERAPESLKVLGIIALPEWAQFSAEGNFRPLKSSPNLRMGWRTLVKTPAELDAAFSGLYPGGIADWYAARSPAPPLTNYREFTNRQTGMYRITAILSDSDAADVIRAGCHQRFCLKRRLWTVEGLGPDDPAQKSILPCLEPCPVLLEFARKAMRLQQEQKEAPEVSPSEVPARIASIEDAISHRDPTLREADFDSPNNPRRQQLALEKLARQGHVQRP